MTPTHTPAQTATEELTPRAREIIAAARELLEEQGHEALSMRALADRLGIRAPSLYKHFASKEALEAALVALAFEEQATSFEAALDTPDDPLAAIATAYRAYAHRHPHLYRLTTERGPDRTRAPVARTEERARAVAVRAAGGDAALARARWGFMHGMTILELNRRFPADADLEAAWQRGLDALLASSPRTSRNRPEL
jgi:AcrR family transcriptional regulator